MSDIIRQAKDEIEAEQRRAAIEEEKARIRERMARPWWHRLIPFTVKIEWRQ